ncbi:hypothetical protein [Hyphomonas pacifica]|uniref:PreQ0 transporter n=1 Tax=Hyphomonas pacifica TaxID=1280941 RepID=A0A062U3V2_9PROT|nr:hypothetical protein [Hyphomonas pacifica]KCZ52977.1 hypothetical protein HY2_00200 [Hyphomonas pacifica]RAN36164.1 hypothetical protein HY3_00870 [Hyphomonas pacifica]RAN37822.1 hypothetical protein HY11_08025 [Hyphomonas pacifica]
MGELVDILTNGNPGQFPLALGALVLTFTAIWMLQGRGWALVYVALIPFLNWSFGVIPEFQVVQPTGQGMFGSGVSLHPMTMVTGMVFVVRDFVQREMGHRVLLVMAMAVAWSFYYAWPVIALASGIAFAISEGVDWLLFTFSKYRLSTRILLSSALAAPVDTTVFLYGADLAKQIELGAAPGNSLHLWNWIVFVIGKMVGAVIVSAIIRRREDLGLTDPAEA